MIVVCVTWTSRSASHEIAIAQAIGEIPANTGLNDIAREPPTPVNGIAVNGLGHSRLQAKATEYHGSAANAPEPQGAESNHRHADFQEIHRREISNLGARDLLPAPP
jgi:hypothetical protein